MPSREIYSLYVLSTQRAWIRNQDFNAIGSKHIVSDLNGLHPRLINMALVSSLWTVGDMAQAGELVGNQPDGARRVKAQRGACQTSREANLDQAQGRSAAGFK